LPGQWLIATPDVIPGGRTERAIDLRFLQLASDIRSNRRDTQLLSVATRQHDLCESGFLSLLSLSPERRNDQADLLALQPNMDIRLHIVAPDAVTARNNLFRPIFSLKSELMMTIMVHKSTGTP
jgi:hypothetical protein